jgi:hypothetical protein
MFRLESSPEEGFGVKRLILAAMCVWLVLPAESALAYVDRGFDPDDRRAAGLDPDIRSTVRRVWITEGSRRALSIKFRAYERLGNYWDVMALLDSKGGLRADYVMDLYNYDQSGRGCAVWPQGHPHQSIQGEFRQRGHTARCKAPARLVLPSKRIRWRLRSTSMYARNNTDIAPNGGGWYR